MSAKPEQAYSADAFIDSMGVNVHLSYRDTPYYKAYDSVIKPRLQELGVRHIRDAASLRNSDVQSRFNDLAKDGIKLTLIVAPDNYTNPSEAVGYLGSIPDAIEAVEGPNEWDKYLEDATYQGQKFPDGLRNFQADLYTATKGNTATARLPVIAPSLVESSYAARLGSVSCDYGNMHSYIDTPGAANLERRWIPDARRVCPDKPIMATESGWNNVLNVQYYQAGVSEQASSKYVPRLYLEFFNRSIQRTFLYEFINSMLAPDAELNMGLLRNDGSPKPAFNALRNLISLLSDPGASFPPQTLNYTLTGATSNIHHTLLQKQNGAFYLILWQEVSGFDFRNKADISVAEQEVSLNLTTPIKQAVIYQPINSVNPLASYANPNQLVLSVPDHLLVIELVPV